MQRAGACCEARMLPAVNKNPEAASRNRPYGESRPEPTCPRYRAGKDHFSENPYTEAADCEAAANEGGTARAIDALRPDEDEERFCLPCFSLKVDNQFLTGQKEEEDHGTVSRV